MNVAVLGNIMNDVTVGNGFCFPFVFYLVELFFSSKHRCSLCIDCFFMFYFIIIFELQQKQKTEDEAESEDDAIEDRFTKIGGFGGGGTTAIGKRRPRVSDLEAGSSSSDSDESDDDLGMGQRRGPVRGGGDRESESESESGGGGRGSAKVIND